MKKLIIFPLIILLLFTSCKTDYIELESRAIVASIGVDKKENLLSVTMELINPNEDDKNAENQIITKTGANFEEAVGAISSSVSKNLFYSHCALIALGEGLNKKDIQSVFKFCFLSNEFTLLLKVVATKSAKELLSIKPKNEKVLGYEIMSALNSRQKNLSIGYNNSFINVGGRRDTAPVLYALPLFKIEGEKEDALYSLDGVKLYKDDAESVVLQDNNAVLFEMLSNHFKSGLMNLKINNNALLIEIKKSKTKIFTELKNGALLINLNLEQTIKTKENYINVKEYKNTLLLSAKELEKISKTQMLDLFYIKEHIKDDNNELYKQIENDFEEYYKKAEINFTVNIKEETND